MKRYLLRATLVGALAAATAAHAAQTDKSDKLDLPLEGMQTSAIVNVPSNDQMQREYPPVALALSLGGQATMTCTVETTGLLDDCRVDSDGPAGLGFGAAALRLAAYFSAKPAVFDGRPVKGKITIPIKFQTGAEFAPPPAEPIPPPTSPAAVDLARQVLSIQQVAAKMHVFANRSIGQMTAQVAASGDAAAGERVADAYRLGLDDAIAQEMDSRARLMAATMTAEQLRATLAYLNSPAGVAYQQAMNQMDDPKRDEFWRRVETAARTHLCAEDACAKESLAGASNQ